MLSKSLIFACVLLWAGLPAMAQESSGLMTLFTTAKERQVINNNRYKKEDKPAQTQQTEVDESLAVRKLLTEEVRASYKVSGISMSIDGSQVAWVNDQAYENGARLQDGSILRINRGADASVSITTPDGKRYTATSGETLDVIYQQAINE